MLDAWLKFYRSPAWTICWTVWTLAWTVYDVQHWVPIFTPIFLAIAWGTWVFTLCRFRILDWQARGRL